MPQPLARPPATEPQAALYCPQCGYDLRALAGEVCPECGLRVDRAALSTSRIPWTHRARIGNVRAYLRTVWMMTVRSNLLPQELSGPVSYRDAQLFRWITVVLASLPMASVLFVLLLWADARAVLAVVPQAFAPGPWGMTQLPAAYDLSLPWLAGAMLRPVLPLGVVLLMIFLSGVHSYWFHPRSISMTFQNRAIALSYYAAAPLVWLPILLMLFAATMAWQTVSEEVLRRRITGVEFQIWMILALLFFFGMLGVVIMIWFSLVRLVKRATADDLPRTIFAAVAIPMAWVLCGVVALYLFPWVVGFFYLVFDSFR